MPGSADVPGCRVALVLGTSGGGMAAHVRMLATGLADRGAQVTVLGPRSVARGGQVARGTRVSFGIVEIGDRPRLQDAGVPVRLRRLLAGAEVVHAHGLRAGALTVLALTLAPRTRRPGVLVTVHNAPPAGGGAAGLVYRLLEHVVARGAGLVLCVSPDLERRMRAAGARRVERAVIAPPDAPPDPAGAGAAAASPPVPAFAAPVVSGEPTSGRQPGVAPAERPVVLAAGRLAAQKGFGVLLEAAAAWRDLDPVPLVVIAGDGPLAGELRARASDLGVDVVFLEHRDDVPALLAAASVFVLPSRWEGQPLVLQEALRAGTPVVATRVGGIPCLAGQDTALLVPPGDAGALAAAVRAVLTDAPLAAALRVAAVTRAATLPSEADAVTAALDAYESARRDARLR